MFLGKLCCCREDGCPVLSHSHKRTCLLQYNSKYSKACTNRKENICADRFCVERMHRKVKWTHNEWTLRGCPAAES